MSTASTLLLDLLFSSTDPISAKLSVTDLPVSEVLDTLYDMYYFQANAVPESFLSVPPAALSFAAKLLFPSASAPTARHLFCNLADINSLPVSVEVSNDFI